MTSRSDADHERMVRAVIARTGLTRGTVLTRLREGTPPDEIVSGRQGGGHVPPNEWDAPFEEHLLARMAVAIAADMGGITSDSIAHIMGITRARVNVITRSALAKIAAVIDDGS